MRDRDREIWGAESGTFFNYPENDRFSVVHSLSIQRLDALLYAGEDRKLRGSEIIRYTINREIVSVPVAIQNEPDLIEMPNNTNHQRSRSHSSKSKPKHSPSPSNKDEGDDKSAKKFRLSFRGNNREKQSNKTRSNCNGNTNCVAGESEGDSETVAREILASLIENMFKNDKKSEVKLRNNKNSDKNKKTSNRRTSITDLLEPNLTETFNYNVNYKRDSNRRDSLYSVEEFDENLDENENKLHKNKAVTTPTIKISKDEKPTNHIKKKNSFFNNLFKRKSDAEKNANPRPGLRKYSSTIELSSPNENNAKNFERSPSFIKKKLSKLIKEDTPALIKRSFSVRDVSKRKENNLSPAEMQWKQSLQSLVENDNSVSYDDMSFINYDTLNTVTYRSKDSVNLHRTQSLIVHGSPATYRPSTFRGASVPPHYASNVDISEHCEALSLPSLHKALRENERDEEDVAVGKNEAEENDVFRVPQTQTRFRRRPQSICSENGQSFRVAKLKRTNACRQKSRNSVSSIDEEIRYAGNSVRSRSLNHLDTLEMRYGVPSSPDAALKDSRSEPDCTKPLVVPPSPGTNPEPQTPDAQPSSQRRNVLSRSQKSSSECFTVIFEVGEESTWDNELIFPAIRGVTLHDSLAKLCELRSIDLNACEAWLHDKETNGGSSSLLYFSQDTASLVGRHIRITAKEASSKGGGHARKHSGSARQKSGFFGSSTEETWTSHDSRLSFQEQDAGKKQGKQRWSGLFGNNKDTKMEALAEQLNSYTKHGVPSSQIYPQGQCESLDALYKLECDWRDIIEYKDLTEKQQQQQTALWELIKTEVAYIKTLKVVTELFLACLRNLQSVGLLKEIDTEKLFSNVTEILDTNVQFWRNSLFPLVKTMRQYRQPACIETMAQGFRTMSDSFQAYYRYCAEQARCQHYCRENHAHNELFTAYLAWCETQKECNRLRLMDILVQPMQRLTKYSLLLKAILKNTDEEVERDTLYLMIESVDEFVNKVNSSLKQKQDNERLRGLIVRIESYDIVEAKDDDLERLLKSSSHLNLNRPMINCPPDRKRHLLLEGDLKLKDSNNSKMEVHCFLLTDMLLVCKPSTKRGGATMRVVRQPYFVDRLEVHELNRETPSLAIIYKNEVDMAVAGFILQNSDSKKLRSWKDGIMKARDLYAQAKETTHYEENLADYAFTTTDTLEGDFHPFQLAPKSPLVSSSRASRVSSLAHSHSGSVEMNDQSSLGSGKEPHSRAVSVEAENRTGSISSDEGVQPLPPDAGRAAPSQKGSASFKQRLFNRTPNTLSVQPFAPNLGQSLPNLALGSPNVGTLGPNQNTLSVPNAKGGGNNLLSPTHRGISYPPPSPTRGNLRRGLAISQSKNPPLQKTRHVSSQASTSGGQVPSSLDFDVPVIAGTLSDRSETLGRRQPNSRRANRSEAKRYHTAGTVDDIKRFDSRDPNVHKRLSWNYGSQADTSALGEET